MNLKPLADRVVIEPKPAETKTAGGLIIPDNAKEKPLEGVVVAVGPGTTEVKMEESPRGFEEPQAIRPGSRIGADCRPCAIQSPPLTVRVGEREQSAALPLIVRFGGTPPVRRISRGGCWVLCP